MWNTLKRIFADPFGLHERWDSIKGRLDTIDWGKLLVSSFAVFSTGITLDKIIELITKNQEMFGVYGSALAAFGVLLVQIKRLYNQGVDPEVKEPGK